MSADTMREVSAVRLAELVDRSGLILKGIDRQIVTLIFRQGFIDGYELALKESREAVATLLAQTAEVS